MRESVESSERASLCIHLYSGLFISPVDVGSQAEPRISLCLVCVCVFDIHLRNTFKSNKLGLQATKIILKAILIE